VETVVRAAADGGGSSGGAVRALVSVMVDAVPVPSGVPEAGRQADRNAKQTANRSGSAAKTLFFSMENLRVHLGDLRKNRRETGVSGGALNCASILRPSAAFVKANILGMSEKGGNP
jgi:hypothetical protein